MSDRFLGPAFSVPIGKSKTRKSEDEKYYFARFRNGTNGHFVTSTVVESPKARHN